MPAYDRLGNEIYLHSLVYLIEERVVFAVRTIESSVDCDSFIFYGRVVVATRFLNKEVRWNLSVYYLTHNTEVIHDQLFPVPF